MVSGYSCYVSKHKNYKGHSSAAYKRPTIEQVNLCSRQNCQFLLNLITNVIAWLWNNQIGLYYQVMIDCLAT